LVFYGRALIWPLLFCIPFADFAAEDGVVALTPEQIQKRVKFWVVRCKIGAIITLPVFVAWIVIAQVFRGSVFPHTWYMLNANDVALTGW
jgi:hypothetical protein